MPKISVKHLKDIIPTAPSDRLTPEQLRRLTDDQRRSRLTAYFPESDESLNFFKVELPPNCVVDQHAHSAAEVIYVLEGSINLGSRVAEPGDAVFVDEYTLYGFRSGSAGCTFLNFRGVPDVAYLSKEQFYARRAERNGND